MNDRYAKLQYWGTYVVSTDIYGDGLPHETSLNYWHFFHLDYY